MCALEVPEQVLTGRPVALGEGRLSEAVDESPALVVANRDYAGWTLSRERTDGRYPASASPSGIGRGTVVSSPRSDRSLVSIEIAASP